MAGFDLGGLIGDIAGSYFQSRAAPQQSFFDLPTWSDLGTAVTPAATATIPAGHTTAGCPPGMMKKKVRRRRKRLATPSDLKDLAALKGVLGGGEAFKVWIATHS